MINIIQGSKLSIPIRFFNTPKGIAAYLMDSNGKIQTSDELGDPLDLTTLAAASICFQNTDLTALTLSLTNGITVVAPALLGKILAVITTTQSALLEIVYTGVLEISLTFTGGTDPVKIQIPQAYSVVQSQC